MTPSLWDCSEEDSVLSAGPGAPSGRMCIISRRRDLSAYVHSDVLFQAYFVAMLNLLGGTYRANPGNPYGSFIDHTGTGLPLPAGSPRSASARSGRRRSPGWSASRRHGR